MLGEAAMLGVLDVVPLAVLACVEVVVGDESWLAVTLLDWD